SFSHSISGILPVYINLTKTEKQSLLTNLEAKQQRNQNNQKKQSMGESVVLWIIDGDHHPPPSSSGSTTAPYCRICHEAEFESFKSLEAPCSCSGTVKYAHRDCIQRWCDEKGNTICEICLQKYEPGYTVAVEISSKKAEMFEEMNTRDSLDMVTTREEEEEEIGSEGLVAQVGLRHVAGEYLEPTTAADRTAAVCRSLALTFTFLLLVRHSFQTLVGGTKEEYPFALITVLILRASGIVFPMYIILRVISSFQKTIHRRHQRCDYEEEDEAAVEEQLHLV
ncbi:E3 ubiquitin-protein ligase MARCHF2, partial [Linum grandiflorum]